MSITNSVEKNTFFISTFKRSFILNILSWNKPKLFRSSLVTTVYRIRVYIDVEGEKRYLDLIFNQRVDNTWSWDLRVRLFFSLEKIRREIRIAVYKMRYLKQFVGFILLYKRSFILSRLPLYMYLRAHLSRGNLKKSSYHSG